MDPNTALENARRACANFRAGVDANATAAELDEYAQDLAEHFAALDGWLSAGGFLPTDWQR